jgi:DNA primase
MLRAAGYPPSKEVGSWPQMVSYITVPWRDEYAQPMTLYGRWADKVPPDGQLKTYALPGAGSKASPLFFDRVRKDHLTEAVMVEGLLDAMLGRALGDNRLVAYVAGQPPLAQHRVLAKHGIKAVTICSDPDKGGDGGILSFIRNADPSVQTYVAPKLPNGMDPDEFMLERGIDGWRHHIDQAEPGYIWRSRYILGKHRLDSAKGRDDARTELAGYASTVADHEWDEIAAVVATPLGMEAGALRRYFGMPEDRQNGHDEAALAAAAALLAGAASRPARAPIVALPTSTALNRISRPGHRPTTDLGNAERTIDIFSDDLRYCSAFKSYLVWDGRH